MEAFNKAKEICPDAHIYVTDDPLQTGSLFLDVEDMDIVVRETNDFTELIKNANNFEIYPIDEEKLKLSVCFDNVFRKV